MTRFSAKAAAAALLAALPCGGCSGAEPGANERPNVLLITIDTLRADRLGAYGYERPTSPQLDRWAEAAAVFEDASAPTSWTLPSLSSLLTGLYPATHGATQFTSRLAPAYPTLAEHLRDDGYDTAAVANHFFLQSRHGLLQGFVHSDEEFAHQPSRPHYTISSPGVTEKAITFLEQKAAAASAGRAAEPFFLWVHYFDPHHVYFAHEGTAPDFGSSEPDLYDAEIAFTDRSLGELFDALERTGLSAETLTVITSDHGEEFLEHGEWQHGKSLYDEVLRVPLLVRGPGVMPGRIAQPVRTIDVTPTLLELTGVRTAAEFSGRSLVPLLRGGDRTTAHAGPPQLGEVELYPGKLFSSLREGRWKLIVDATTGRLELYDLRSDPQELDDRAAAEPELAARLRSTLQAALEGARRAGERYARLEELTLNPGDIDNLRSLGYVEGDSEEPPAGAAPAPGESR